MAFVKCKSSWASMLPAPYREVWCSTPVSSCPFKILTVMIYYMTFIGLFHWGSGSRPSLPPPSLELGKTEFQGKSNVFSGQNYPANIVVQGQYWSDTSGCTGPIWQACTGPVTFCTQAPLWPCTVCLQWTCTELYWANTEHVDNHDMGFIHYFCIGPVQ